MLLIVCMSSPLEVVGIAVLTGKDVTGASVASCCFSSSGNKTKLCAMNVKGIS